jgi:riboflavin synthase
MFTGIIEELGRVRSLRRTGISFSLEVEAHRILEGTRVGDSVATNGVCLTVTRLSEEGFTADVMPETVHRTALGRLVPGSRVNLELAMALGDRLGGHLVSGHVDAVARLARRVADETALRLTFEADAALLRHVVEKGSVAVNGVSLTVTGVDASTFSVSLIPLTQGETNLTDLRVGDEVNIESDMIIKYVERLLGASSPAAGGGGLTEAMLLENGF